MDVRKGYNDLARDFLRSPERMDDEDKFELAEADTYRHDVEEALSALAGSQTMRDAGIDERFAQVYAKHAHRFDLLPEPTRQRLAAQFAHLAFGLSYAEAVGRVHPETLQRHMAAWLKGTLLFLVHQTYAPDARASVEARTSEMDHAELEAAVPMVGTGHAAVEL